EETGVTVALSTSSNTNEEMMALAADLMSAAPDEAITAISFGADWANVRGPGLASLAANGADGGGTPWAAFLDFTASLSSANDVTIGLEDDFRVPTMASRTTDTNNFRGGTRYHAAGYGNCTMGFGAKIGSAYAILTAAHCSGYLEGMAAYGPASSTSIGVVDYVLEMNDTAPPYDLGVVVLNSGITSTPYVYANPRANVTVKGYATGGIVMEATYCSSGNHSLGKCNLLSKYQEFACDPESNPYECFYAIVVESTDSNYVTCQGDSGGPVYYHHNGLASTDVTAAGIISYAYVYPGQTCGTTGGISVVASAIQSVPSLQIPTG
ncbi:MAG: trypsin-like serine protease, partial [Bifidobacteriaceae bacterium]|nr:trypsin-like serine protease [Bifidobacteriaceae bacterium]